MKYIPRQQLEHLMWTQAEGQRQRRQRPTSRTAVPPFPSNFPLQGPYELMEETSTYAEGVHALREACEHDSSTHPLFVRDDESRIYRPLTFREVLQAKVGDYNTLKDKDGATRSFEDRVRFFEHWVDSSTGIIYKAETTKFKIVPLCKPLVEIDKDFNDAYLPIEYDSLEGHELDQSRSKYDELLSKAAILRHPAWLAAVGGDRALLQEYRNIVFNALKEKSRETSSAMGFYVMDETTEDQLRALFVYNLDSYSNANGNRLLYGGGSFLRVAHAESPEGRAPKRSEGTSRTERSEVTRASRAKK